MQGTLEGSSNNDSFTVIGQSTVAPEPLLPILDISRQRGQVGQLDQASTFLRVGLHKGSTNR